MSDLGGFVPPPYPYDRLDAAKAVASAHPGGIVDLSIGTPTDPPPPAVAAALAGADEAGSVRGFEDWSKVMRLAAICFAVSTLAASSSLAQTVPAAPSSSG